MIRVRETLLLLVAILMVGCSGSPSTADYAQDVETLVTTMNARIDQLDFEADGSSDLEQIQDYAESRVAARTDFVAGLQKLEPPDEVKGLHDTALEIMERLTNTEAAMVDRVMKWVSADDIDDIWETPEGRAARTADAQAVSLCHAAQAEFDQTADRAEFKDVPWVPTEMKAVILVAFGCEADAR